MGWKSLMSYLPESGMWKREVDGMGDIQDVSKTCVYSVEYIKYTLILHVFKSH